MFRCFFDFYFKKIILCLIIFLSFTKSFCVDVNNLFVLDNSLQSLSKLYLISKEKPELKLILVATIPSSKIYKYGTVFLQLIIGDILSIPADAIVNAANEQCLGGGGIDHYITKMGGGALAKAREKLPIVSPPDIRCPSFSARITRAGELKFPDPILGISVPFKYVLHAVGPVCGGAVTDEQKAELAKTYINTLQRADAFNKNPKDKSYTEFKFVDIEDLKPHYKITKITFPAISTGIFGCATKETAEPVVKGVLNYLKDNQNTDIKIINFAFYDPASPKKAKKDFTYYEKALSNFL